MIAYGESLWQRMHGKELKTTSDVSPFAAFGVAVANDDDTAKIVASEDRRRITIQDATFFNDRKLPALAAAIQQGAVVTLRRGSVVAEVEPAAGAPLSHVDEIRRELLSTAFVDACQCLLDTNNTGLLFYNVSDAQLRDELKKETPAGADNIGVKTFDVSGSRAANAVQRMLRSLCDDGHCRWRCVALFHSAELPHYLECTVDADERASLARSLVDAGFTKRADVPLGECDQRPRIEELHNRHGVSVPRTVTAFAIDRPVLLLVAPKCKLHIVEAVVRDTLARLPHNDLLPIETTQQVLSRRLADERKLTEDAARRWRCVNLRGSRLPVARVLTLLEHSIDLQCVNLTDRNDVSFADVARLLNHSLVAWRVVFCGLY